MLRMGLGSALESATAVLALRLHDVRELRDSTLEGGLVEPAVDEFDHPGTGVPEKLSDDHRVLATLLQP